MTCSKCLIWMKIIIQHHLHVWPIVMGTQRGLGNHLFMHQGHFDVIIGSGNGLVLNRRQGISCTNVGQDLCCHIEWLDLNELRKLIIQSSVIITKSNTLRYYITIYRNWDWISIWCWIHKTHSIPCPNRQAMGCLLWIYVRKLTEL